MIQFRRFMAVVGMALAVASCDDSTQKPVGTEKFEGILQTDELCNIVGGDTTDFLPRPEAFIDTTVFPPIVGPPLNTSLVGACPNPAGRWTEVHFNSSETGDSIWLFAYDEPGAPPVDTLFARRGTWPGSYLVVWAPPLGPGIYRVRMFTESGFRSYGDVEFTDTPVNATR